MVSSGKLFIAGHKGMVGKAIVREAERLGFSNVIVRDRAELDLCEEASVDAFYAQEKPETVIVAAAKVGGIHANNTYPAEFLRENLAIAQNTIHLAYKHKVSRLLFLGSSCIYPKHATQPMIEDVLLTGALEPTNEAYAIAKIAGLKLCQFYRQQYGLMFHSLMPTNLYGPGDNYHLENSHVLPALIRRFHEAKMENASEVVLWGTGSPRREFLHVDDLAAAVFHVLNIENPAEWYNVGTGTDVTILELAELVKKVTGFSGALNTDPTKPDGSPRKLLDISKLQATGWSPKISLESGIARTYEAFLRETEAGEIRT